MPTTLVQYASELTDIVAQSGPSVVRVDARGRIPASGIVWSEDGLILSASHVVEVEEEVNVGLAGGAQATASIVGRDPSTDVIVLRVKDQALTVPSWTDSSDVAVGAPVIAMGRPRRELEVSTGVVSAIVRPRRQHSGHRADRFLRPDIVMYPGFSGGPLALADGSFAGMNTSGLFRDANATVASESLRTTVETLVTHGRVPVAFLGVGVQPVRISTDVAEGAGVETGLMVMSVEDESPASRAGVRQGDILIALDDNQLASVGHLRAALSGADTSDTSSLRVVRGTDTATLSVHLELR